MPRPPLPEHVAWDRLERYENGEPLASIAHDHNITVCGLLNFIRRRDPTATGHRARGPRPKDPDA